MVKLRATVSCRSPSSSNFIALSSKNYQNKAEAIARPQYLKILCFSNHTIPVATNCPNGTMGLSIKQTVFVPSVPLKYFFLISNFGKYLPVTLTPANSFINPARSFCFFCSLLSFPSAVLLASSNPRRVPLYPHLSPHTCVFVHVAHRRLWLFFRQQPRRLDCHNLWF